MPHPMPRLHRSPARTILGIIIGAACALATLASCAQPKPDDGPVGPLPTIAEVIARYNARVERLEAVESPIELVVNAVDDEGKVHKEQGEGNLKMVRPRKIALRVDKVSQTFFWLGSNDEKYWWFDLRGDEKVALVGTHALATPEVVARFGLPVHPVDLLDLAGVAPLEMPATDQAVSPIARAPDGRNVVLTLPGRWGTKRLVVNPTNGEVSAVEMSDAQGKVVASSRLERYERVPVRGQATAEASMATRIHADVPAAHATIELIIHTPVNNGVSRIKPANFDYEDLKSRMGITKEIDLDNVESAPR